MTDIHKHCPVCNTPIPLDETTCSPKCQKVLRDRQAQMKRSRMIFICCNGYIHISIRIYDVF